MFELGSGVRGQRGQESGSTDLPEAGGSSEMELVLEKRRDFLLRPRADM